MKKRVINKRKRKTKAEKYNEHNTKKKRATKRD